MTNINSIQRKDIVSKNILGFFHVWWKNKYDRADKKKVCRKFLGREMELRR
jgi:hypothetical protein